ncbi:hypothetical protein [Ekhidna sp.]|uniref:hypothetical protein n=1 Tax=Ekhidna sp. TaxID=2608089 RepID=UPI003CCBECEA
MKLLYITIALAVLQSTTTIVKNNGDQIELKNVLIYQNEKKGSPDVIVYSYRGAKDQVKVKDIKRISFKETIQKKKGITTYRVILVKANNDKLEVEIDLVKVEGLNDEGKKESLSLGSVDKISF